MDLHEFSIKELRKLCKSKGIKRISACKKEELIRMISLEDSDEMSFERLFNLDLKTLKKMCKNKKIKNYSKLTHIECCNLLLEN